MDGINNLCDSCKFRTFYIVDKDFMHITQFYFLNIHRYNESSSLYRENIFRMPHDLIYC